MNALQNLLDSKENPRTKQTYFYSVQRFLHTLYPEKGDVLKLADRYIREYPKRDFVKDVRKALAGMPGKSASVTKAAVVEFLRENGIEPDLKILRCLKNRKLGIVDKARTVDAKLTADDIKKIITYLPLKEKTMTLLMTSGGLRIGEVFGLHAEDIHLDRAPVGLDIRGAKDGSDRTIYISAEAAEALKAFLTVKKGPVFPGSYRGFLKVWVAALGKADPHKPDEVATGLASRGSDHLPVHGSPTRTSEILHLLDEERRRPRGHCRGSGRPRGRTGWCISPVHR